MCVCVCVCERIQVCVFARMLLARDLKAAVAHVREEAAVLQCCATRRYATAREALRVLCIPQICTKEGSGIQQKQAKTCGHVWACVGMRGHAWACVGMRRYA